MRIEKITVSDLFDQFNHDLEFNEAERITIMIGPNGFGKTMMLRIVNALFNQPIRTLARFPFREVAPLNRRLGYCLFSRSRHCHIVELLVGYRTLLYLLTDSVS